MHLSYHLSLTQSQFLRNRLFFRCYYHRLGHVFQRSPKKIALFPEVGFFTGRFPMPNHQGQRDQFNTYHCTRTHKNNTTGSCD